MRQRKDVEKLLKKYNIPYKKVGQDIYLYPQFDYNQELPDTLQQIYKIIAIYTEGSTYRYKKDLKHFDHIKNRRKTKQMLHHEKEFYKGKVYRADPWDFD